MSYKVNHDRMSLGKDIGDAVKSGDQAKLNELLTSNGYTLLNYRNDYHGSLLHEAAELGNVSMVKYLLEAGCEIEASDLGEGTPLVRASCNEDAVTREEITRLLLKKGAKPNVICERKPAIHHFVDSGCLESAALLVQHGAKINSRESRHGFTMLHKAAAHKNNDKILWLLEHGANPSLDSNAKRSTLQFAMQSRGPHPMNYDFVPCSEVLCKLLEHGSDPNAKLNRGGTTVFHKILQHAELDVVMLFVRHGGRVGTLNKGKAVREQAAKNKDKRVLAVILELQKGKK